MTFPPRKNQSLSALSCRGLTGLICCLMLCSLAACSARQGYAGAQQMEQSRCASGPANQYEACMQRANMSYDEYQQKRAEQDNDS